jgi:hypothetical protein
LKLVAEPDEGDDGESLHAITPRARETAKTVVDAYFMRSSARDVEQGGCQIGCEAEVLGLERLDAA